MASAKLRPVDTATDLTWAPVSRRWYAHRSEPLLQERLWGCDLPFPDHSGAESRYSDEGGHDRAGNAVGWRQRGLADDGEMRWFAELAEWDGAVRTVRLLDGAVVRTVFDGDGRAVRTDYEGVRHFGRGCETYEYDRDGRLVAINEYVGLFQTVSGSMIEPTGGRLVVEHDDHGACLITDSNGDVRWQRFSGDWKAELAAYADQTAADFLAAARAAGAGVLADPDDRAFALRLIYVEGSSSDFTPMVSMESELVDVGPGPVTEEIDIPLLGDIALLEGGDDLPLDYDGVEGDYTVDDAMLRVSCQMDPGEPQRVVLGEVAKRLAVADWTGVFTPTDDFVVFIAEHDEDFAPKLRSIHAHNPPDRVARWEARRRALAGG